MSEIDTGGPAFPMPGQCIDEQWEPASGFTGMTARDYFATRAMHAILTDHYYRQQSCSRGYGELADEAAEEAYAVADAMLRARQKTPHST